MFNIPTVTVASETLGSAASSVTLTYAAPAGVSWTPRHLVLRVNAKSTTTAAVVGGRLQLNGDTGSNYNSQELYGVGTGKTATRDSSVTSYFMGGLDGNDSNEFGGGELLIPDALSTRTHKSLLNFTGANEAFVGLVAGRWASTAAVTSINYSASSGNLDAGSTFELCVVDESFNVSETILTSNSSSAGFAITGISAANGDLVCIGTLRSTRSDNADSVRTRLNGDTTDTNYNTQRMFGDANTAGTSSQNLSQNAVCTAASSEANSFGAYVNQITNFSDGSNDRVQTTLNGFHEGTTPRSYVAVESTRWNNTAAVTAVQQYCNGYSFVTGSMMSIYAVPKNLIERIEITGDSEGSKTFADISQEYDHLELSIYARSARSNTVDDMFVYFNSDTTAGNYAAQRLSGTDSTVSASTSATEPSITTIAAANASSDEFSAGSITISNYTKTDRHKHHIASVGTSVRTTLNSNRWASTAAITSITLVPVSASNFLTGTTFELRGISSTITEALPAAGYTIFF